MEKITLKPIAQELLFKGTEADVYYDVMTCSGNSAQERTLGSLYVLSCLKQKDSDLAYLVSLVSSLAKREYYAPANAGQEPKIAFERTLKKINEVLEDFFKNQDFALHLGLAAITGENILISRLGKFKVALARNGEYIDILNNIDLFSKEGARESKFANIVSGKLLPGDKLFAYFPSRSVTSREKMLNPLFVKESQENFNEKLALLASSVSNFSCCGVHIDIKQAKEIAVVPMPDVPMPEVAVRVEPTPAEVVISAPGRDVLRSQLSVTKRTNIFNKLTTPLVRLVRMRYFNKLVLAVVVVGVVGLAGWKLLGSGGSSEIQTAYKQASSDLQTAKSKLSQNDASGARNLLMAAMVRVAGLADKKSETLKTELNQTLDSIDKVSDKLPALYYTAKPENKFKQLAFFADKLVASGEDKKLYQITPPDTADSYAALSNETKFLYKFTGVTISFNGLDVLEIYNTSAGKVKTITLKDPLAAQDAVIYQDNLYVLSGGAIYKYADAALGSNTRSVWSSEPVAGNSLSVDGNVNVLADNGQVNVYFAGKKNKTVQLQIVPSADSKLYSFKDTAIFYVYDPLAKRVHVFDKADGILKTTYKLNSVGTVQSLTVAADGTIWMLAGDNKIYQLK